MRPLFGVLLIGLALAATPLAAADRPNVVVILADDKCEHRHIVGAGRRLSHEMGAVFRRVAELRHRACNGRTP